VTSFRTLDDLGDVDGKRGLVRVDLNVPMQDGKVSDDTRLRAALATVCELADKEAIVLLLSHFGRPKGERRPDMEAVLPMTDALRAELPEMLRQHTHIAAAARRLGEVASAEGDAEVEELARKLQLHARSEEEIFYPAAVLVGELVRSRLGSK